MAIWLIAILSLTSISAVRQDETPMPLSEYWETIRSTRQALAQMESSPEGQVKQQLSDLAAKWERVTAVEISKDNVVAIDPSFLVAELKTNPPNIARLKSLLDALLAAHQQYPQEVFTVQDIEPLRGILARPEFQWEKQAQASESPAWLQKIFDFFDKLMERLSYGVQNTIYYGRVPLIVAAVIIFLISLYFLSLNLSRNLVREAQLAIESEDADALLTSSGAMQRAQSLSSQGDYRNAVRYLYLSSLLVLDERGLLRYDRSRTNREYLRSISSKPELSKPLSDVIDVFDRVWYGFESVDENTFQSYVKHVDELREKKE
ncbi:MAG: DUF4129 domain-containing protein [Anaerolineales bacterium]|nr:DUF4129 domain-containing protein [Anaerolineales bacterium]